MDQPTNQPVGAPQQDGKGLAIASLVCGIVGLFFFGIILGPLAIVFSVMARKKGFTSGMATAGLVLGIIAVVLYVIAIVLCGSAMTAFLEMM